MRFKILGLESITRFDHPRRSFTKAFCTHCGSGLPHVTQNGKNLIVPAGCLNSEPAKTPDAQIFCSEQTQWHQQGLLAKKLIAFLTKK